MNKENKIRLFALSSLVFIISSPFIMTLYPKTIPYFLYPVVGVFMALAPALFALPHAPSLGKLIVKTYKFYHEKRGHKFKEVDDEPKRVISRFQVSLLASFYPLGIVFKIFDDSSVVNEIDMVIVASVFAAQFIIMSISYALFVLSRSKIMVKFDDGNQFNIGDRVRDKLTWFAFGSTFVIMTMVYQSIVFDQLLFLGTLAISASICFGSNILGFYILERMHRIPVSVRQLKKLLKE